MFIVVCGAFIRFKLDFFHDSVYKFDQVIFMTYSRVLFIGNIYL